MSSSSSLSPKSGQNDVAGSSPNRYPRRPRGYQEVRGVRRWKNTKKESRRRPKGEEMVAGPPPPSLILRGGGAQNKSSVEVF